MTQPKELFPLRRMAARLGVTNKWLREQAEAGKVPGLRAGDRWIFAPDATINAVRIMAGAESVPANESEATNDAI